MTGPRGLARGAVAALAALLGPAALQAAPQLPVRMAVDVASAYTDNLFASHTGRADWINRLSLDVEAGGAARSAYYSGQASLYREYGDLFGQTHTLGLTASCGRAARRTLAADLSGTLSSGRPGHVERDWVEADAHATAKVYLAPALMLRLSSGLDLREYRQATAFSWAVPTAGVQLSRFLASRTTLAAGLDAGAKAYLRAPGAGTGQYARTGAQDRQAVASAWLKVAQAAGPRAGLQLIYGRQDLLGEGTRYPLPGAYDPELELFDDEFSYSGNEVRAVLKRLDAAGLDLLASAWREQRRYEGRPALALDGQPAAGSAERRDRRTGVSLRVDRELAGQGTAASPGVALRLEAEWLNVDSTDAYYDAAARLYSVTLRLHL